jgi:peptide/nickel transport system substrate-binding protein
MTKSAFFRFVTLLVLIALTVSGCSGGSGTTIVVEDTEAPASQAEDYTPDTYKEAGYYAPGDAAQYVAPAPESTSAEATQAPSEAYSPDDFQQAEPSEDEPYTDADELATVNMDKGDVTLGVVVGTDAEVNPLRCKYRDLIDINSLVYEGLIELNENMLPEPQLADRWETDGSTWTFTLRSSIVFHDGSPLTADDVVASYKEILNYPSGQWYPLVSQLVGINAVDDKTVEVKSTGDLGYMTLYAMTFPVVSAASVADDMPMGTGPYWYIQYSVNNSLRIESNPFWWRRASGDVQSLVAIFYSSTKSALSALETGDIDTICTESSAASIARNLNDRMAVDYSTQTYECIVPNLNRQILSSLAVRQAIMYAIDRTAVSETVYAGLVQESEVPVLPGTWLYDAQSTKFNYSPERALQLLYDDGWSDPDGDGVLQKELDGSIVKLELTLMTYDRGTTSTRSDAAKAIAEELGKVGFSVTVETVSSSDALSNLRNGKFDMALVAFELSEMPNLAFLLASTGDCNYARYVNTDMDTLLKQAYAAADADSLKSAMSKVQMRIIDDLPILGLYFRTGLVVSKQSIGGLSGSRQGNTLRGLATATRN